MAQKILFIDGLGRVVLQKRRGSRNIRLTVSHEGNLRVSLPTWAPYKAGEAFVISKAGWIRKQQAVRPIHVFQSGHRIGKGHRLDFIYEARGNITSRISGSSITIRLPLHTDSSGEESQQVIKKAAMRALKQEANKLLPGRLASLAAQHGFSYRSVHIKQLKTRWGSCNSQKEIALNCFLMQLPWELIDYVLLHELLHTRIMAHGEIFWKELAIHVNNLPAKRSAIRAYQPSLIIAM